MTQSFLLPLRSAAKLAALFAGVVFLLASCGSSVPPLNEEAARLLDIENNLVADLTNSLGAEQVPLEDLLRAAARAEQAGTELRIVVAGPDDVIRAESVVDRYGGTALTYQVDRTGFEAASRDISVEQVRLGLNAARAGSIGDSASAFVDVLEDLDITTGGGSSSRAWLLWLLVPSALFMLWGAWSYFQARNKRVSQRVAFDERHWVLTDWASKLAPEVEALRQMVATSPNDAFQHAWHQSHDLVNQIAPALENAKTIGDLDVAEIRIGQAALELRNLRTSLTA